MTLALPDEPRWVEAHGIAADPESWRRDLGDGVAVGSPRARLVVIANAEAEAALEVARAHSDHAILVADEQLATALGLAGREVARAILHTLRDPAELPDLEGASVLLASTSLAHLPPELRDEITAARTPVWATWVDGEPVSFAYAPWRSPRWFDVSVDTLRGARQLGLATITAATMIRAERALGREPVWGADEDNAASLALARRLGFVPVDELWVAAPTR